MNGGRKKTLKNIFRVKFYPRTHLYNNDKNFSKGCIVPE